MMITHDTKPSYHHMNMQANSKHNFKMAGISETSHYKKMLKYSQAAADAQTIKMLDAPETLK